MDSQKRRYATVSSELSKSNLGPKCKEDIPKISATHRNYQAHSGMKFNFNSKRDVILKSFTFEEKEKVYVSTAQKQIGESQIEDGFNDSGDCIKVSRVKIPINVSTENVSQSKILTKNVEDDLCSRVDKSLRVVKPSLQASKVMKSQAFITLKPQTVTSNTSKLPTLDARQALKVSKSQPSELKEYCKSGTGRNIETLQKGRYSMASKELSHWTMAPIPKVNSSKISSNINLQKGKESVVFQKVSNRTMAKNPTNSSLMMPTNVNSQKGSDSMVCKDLSKWTMAPKPKENPSKILSNMNSHKGEHSMISKEFSNWTMASKAKDNSSRISSTTHENYKTHGGLKFKFLVNRSSVTCVEQSTFTSSSSKSSYSKSVKNSLESKEVTYPARCSMRK